MVEVRESKHTHLICPRTRLIIVHHSWAFVCSLRSISNLKSVLIPNKAFSAAQKESVRPQMRGIDFVETRSEAWLQAPR